MGEIRGDRVVFRKQDIVPLHRLPSAQAHDPIVVHTPAPSRVGFACRAFAGVVSAFVVIGVVLVALVEAGVFDSTLNAQAVAALNRALGPRYAATVEHTVLRVSGLGGLALKAENVRVVEAETDEELARTDAVAMVLDPLALAGGRIAVSRLDLDGARFDASHLPESGPIDLSGLRISDVPDYLQAAFERLDGIGGLISNNSVETIRISDVAANLRTSDGREIEIAIPQLRFTRANDGNMSIKGRFSLEGNEGEIDLSAKGSDNILHTVDGAIRSVPLASLFMTRDEEGAPWVGVESLADISVNARRETAGAAPVLKLDVTVDGGQIHAEGVAAALHPSAVSLSYNFDKGSLQLASNGVKVGASMFPFGGAIIDLDRVSDRPEKGFAVDLLVSDAVVDPVDTDEAPIRFDAKVNGSYLPESRRLLFDELAVSSPKGAFAGSLALRFGGPAPEASFVMIADTLQADAVKQFWPYWLAKNTRSWVVEHIYGGTVSNGRIEVFLPADRERVRGEPPNLSPEQLKIDFDLAGARINIAGDIPPVRDTSGRFRLRGGRTEIALTGGTTYFPSGRSVELKGGTFVLPDGRAKPLMAQIDLDVAGNADAIAELVTYRPIRALPSTGFVPDDFSGHVDANVKAYFGLQISRASQAPPPEWTAALSLSRVAVKKPIAGRQISDLTGSLAIDPARAHLKAKGELDGVGLDIELDEPLGSAAGGVRQTVLSGRLGDADRRKLLPGLQDIVEGPVAIRVEQKGDGPQHVEADVGAAAVSVPWLGWTKGAGVGGKVTLEATSKDGKTHISDFRFTGDGFSVAGTLDFQGERLETARFSNVRLSPEDRFSVEVNRGKGGYSIAVNGEAADLRPVLARLKNAGRGGSGGASEDANVRLQLGRASGFNGERVGNLSLSYASHGGKISSLDLSAVMAGGTPLVGKLAKSGNTDMIELTSGDAGAVARFADVYRHMRGGLLNVRMGETANGWRGSVDIRNFSLVGEERLRSLVATPAGESGRSLNQAVRREIDVSAVRFNRGFAQVSAAGGTLSVNNGVVRGETVGATFQGVVRDANGDTDMTGTFMPAYGLNRLFAELPLIGIILGNGRDRGLLGITFKLSGPFDKPRLTINPLSIIAPGVFRSIFEFQ